ncbi:unnamed protein product [Orchesella dallaii]|uniref:Peptidase S1 domain-containing protein n=1 Tax=Orchesella dallaii TaxID=48710 RepID=A0ABP1S841_9HEXA
MARSKTYFWAGVVSIIFLLQLVDAQSRACDYVYGGQPCPYGFNEIYRKEKSGQVVHRGCCHPSATDAERMPMAGVAEGCDTTSCAPPWIAEPCKYAGDFVVNGTHLVYEEAHKETCTTQRNQGTRAYCCRPDSLEGALVSTYGAEPNEFVHQVMVGVNGDVCGGTIYNKRYVITAAHCVVNKQTRRLTPLYPRENYLITIGTNMRVNGKAPPPEFVYGVEDVIVHEGYSHLEGSVELQKLARGEYQSILQVPVYDDVALIRLDRDIPFGPTVKALRLADKEFNPIEYAKTAVIAGWGTSESGRVMGYLQKANPLIRTDERCFKIDKMSSMGNLREKLMCVGGILDGKWSAMVDHGDSGGPAVCRGKDGKPILCGIASFMIDTNCLKGDDENSCHPSVFVEVGNYKKWVERKIPEGQDEGTLFNGPLYGTPVSAPHQVRVTSASTSRTGKSCGGTLIQPDIVVTAAHCIMYDETTLLAGIKVVTSQGQTLELAGSPAVMPGFKKLQKPYIAAEHNKHGVERVVMRDNFYENDLAILRLTQNVPGVTADQLPRLPERHEKAHGAAMELSVSTDAPENGLRQRNFNIIDKADCQTRMNRLGMLRLKSKVSDNIICGVEQYSGGSQCDRELGGGLICEGNVLCGVQSFRLCEWSLPNAFVDMSQRKSIVESAIKMLRK